MTKIALIINGDTEPRHLKNVERALGNVLEKEGYETYVANPKKPKAPHNHYVSSTLENIKKLVDALKGKIRPGDELVIYTTGHGEKEGDEGSLCLGSDCDYKTITPLLDSIPFGRRTVVMDQCYGGNWNKVFTDDPKTLFVATGGRNETVCCEEMAPLFWAKGAKIPDLNSDGVVSWQERYAYSIIGITSSEPQFVPSPGYIEDGTSVFEAKVLEVEGEEELNAQISRLKPGQYVIINFSPDWCGPCQEYKPSFAQMAKEGDGQHLWAVHEK